MNTIVKSLLWVGLLPLMVACQDDAVGPAKTPPTLPLPDDPQIEEPLDWQPQEEAEACNEDALLPAHVGVRRVKNLLTGQAPTSAELEAVQADPAKLREHVTRWIATPEFKDKLQSFFTVTLQQAQVTRREYVSQLSDSDTIAGLGGPDALWNSINESFARTAMKIVEDERPFHEIASTRTWMMTTGMMAFMIHIDKPLSPTVRFYHEPFTDDALGVTFDSQTSPQVQMQHGTFYSTEALTDTASGCAEPYVVRSPNNNRAKAIKRALFTVFITGRAPNTANFCKSIRLRMFQNSDYNDWRPVTMTTMDPTATRQMAFYNAPALRDANQLPLTIARAGFFTTPSFLAGWRTNTDNSFRVTTNQTLIVGLGLAFEDTDTTTPLGDEGLAADHASPGTQCYSCHKNLDPMRNFFDGVFLPETYGAKPVEDRDNETPSFSFQGYSQPGTTLADLGAILAGHPYFATGWTQKMCMFANSKKCNAQDPEFARVVKAFEDSNFNFKVLLIELFSSPLVTGASCAPGDEGDFAVVSVARREHLCKVLANRLNQPDVCAMTPSILALSTALPSAAWPRGSDVPAMPTEPSLFYAAGEKSLCKDIATELVDAPGSPLQSANMDGALNTIVQEVMGVLPTDPRHEQVSALMAQHINQVAGVESDPSEQLRSAFVVACTSPFVTSTDF